MKAIIGACMCLCMIGCGGSPESKSEQTATTSKNDPPSDLGISGQPHEIAGGCNAPFTMIIVDGVLTTVPSLCNQGLCQGPDHLCQYWGDPWKHYFSNRREEVYIKPGMNK